MHGTALSICIPSYNLEEWTRDAVVSALSVGHPDEVEVVVVDDGSTDGTLESIRDLEAPNLRVLAPPEHAGMTGNFNRAVRASSGRWVTVLGADDDLFPSYYEHLRPHVGRDDTSAFAQIAMMQWDGYETTFGSRDEREIPEAEFLRMLGGSLCISTTAFRRDLFDLVGGFDDRVGSLFDYDLFYRMARASGRPIRALGVEGGRYYPLRGSTWTRHEEAGEASELLLHWLELHSHELDDETRRATSAALSARARAHGWNQLGQGNRSGAARNFAVASRCAPDRDRWKTRAGSALVHAPAPLVNTALAARKTRRRGGAPGGRPQATRYDVDRGEMLAYVPHEARRILDVGCAAGRFGAALKEEAPDRVVVGIEPDPIAAAEARDLLDDVIEGELSEHTLDLAGHEPFDVIVFNDVLEHMVTPVDALVLADARLADGGVVVASIPNVRHITAVGPLVVRGQWRYRDIGVLDSTHLRFFTASSIQDLFADAGWRILRMDPINHRLHLHESAPRWWMRALGRVTLGATDPFFVLQYAVVAEPVRSARPATGD